MPKILDRLVSQLEEKWKPRNVAFAIAISSLQKNWNLKKWTKTATAKWKKRWDMTPAQRAKDRASKISWISKDSYKYKKSNNTAVLKSKK